MSGERVKMLKNQKDKYGPFQDDLEEIPYYMRDRVAYLIDQKVEKRVQAHMQGFRDEVMRELEDQRLQNQSHIAHYMQPQHFTGKNYPAGYGYGHQGYNGYMNNGYNGIAANHPGYRRTSISPRRQAKYVVDLDDSTTDVPQLEWTQNRRQILTAPYAAPIYYKPKSKKTKRITNVNQWDGYTSTKDRQVKEEQFERSERRKAYDVTLRDNRGPHRNIAHQINKSNYVGYTNAPANQMSPRHARASQYGPSTGNRKSLMQDDLPQGSYPRESARKVNDINMDDEYN